MKNKLRAGKTKALPSKPRKAQPHLGLKLNAPQKGQPKTSVANSKKPWKPIDHGADIRKQIEGEMSSTDDELRQFFSKGEKSINLAESEIRKSIFILTQFACFQGQAENALEKLIPGGRTQAVDAMCSIAGLINALLIELAKAKNSSAAERIWDNGVEMVSAIKTLAQIQPDLLKPKARKALYMPSFRARAEKFSDDFNENADAIELSRDIPPKTGGQAHYDLDSLVTKYAVKKLMEAEEARKLLAGMASVWDEIHKDKKYPAGLTREQSLLNLPGILPEHLSLLDLPRYNKASAKLWWEKYFKPHLDSAETLEQIEGTELYEFLSDGAKLPVDYEIRDFFKKLCKNKVLQSLAP